MTSKTKNIISIVIGAIPSAMLVMSGIMKLSNNPKIVDEMTKGGFGPYITILGLVELISVILFFYPKTTKLGFYLICSYLGGALAVQLSMGSHMPISAVLLALFWISMFIKGKANFITTNNSNN